MPPLSTPIYYKQAIGLATETSIAHHIKGIRPALLVMEELGFTTSTCLKGTGIRIEQLEQAEQGISLQQELAFYRQLLELSQDAQLGLKLGKAYRLENYGMLGYAILSAQNLAEALSIAKDFGPLSFSHFEVDFAIEGNEACIIMRQNKALDTHLLSLYEDRDCTAIIHGTRSALNQSFPISGIDLMQTAPVSTQAHEANFHCPIQFQQSAMRIRFPIDVLSIPMPLRDPETSTYCRQQCKLLLDRISQKRSVIEQVRECLGRTENGFPNIKDICKTLDIPERSLRRQLSQAGYQFQALLNEVRYQKAKALLSTELNLEAIAQTLGYSEAGNFSHAFKRWSGVSPKRYRDQQLRAAKQDI